MYSRKSSCVVWGIMVVMTLWVGVGCSERKAEPVDVAADVRGELGLLEGAWESVSTSDSTNDYLVVIGGDTLRIRSTDAGGKVMLRHSVGIDQVDELRSLIILDGTAAAWPYDYKVEGEAEQLKLEFLIPETQQWKKLDLQRASSH